MKKLKVILIILLLPFIVYGIYSIRKNNSLTNTVQAFGNLTATYLGVQLGQPIFNITNLSPGAPEIVRSVKIKNDGKNTEAIYVKGIRKGPDNQTDPKLETVLDLVIKENGNVVYSGKLSKFFEDSASNKGIKLDSIKKGKTIDFDFIVTFPETAGNEFQGKSVIFDIAFGQNGDVKGDKDEKEPHDNRFDEKKPEKGNDDKGHNNPNERKSGSN